MRVVFIILYIHLLTLSHTCLSQASGDSTKENLVRIDEVFIVGNKKTKKEIILREVSFSSGEYYLLQELKENIKKDRNLVYNTNLFNEVKIQVLETKPDEVDILIQVSERWYLYPAPIFKIADRNLMDWLINRSGELNRFNYGLKVDHFNFRGRNERLSFIGQVGFERRFLLRYAIPYIEKTQKHGLILETAFNERENMPYITRDHLPEFLRDDEINRQTFSAAITHSYRPSFYSFHYTTIGYQTSTVSDTIVSLNPNFFGNSEKSLKNFNLRYTYVYDRRNNRNFPTKGNYLKVDVDKYGLGIYNDIDLTSLRVIYSKYFDLGKDFYLASGVVGFTSFPEDQPYFYYNGLGYNDIYVRGFELDVIEGSSFLLSRNSFRKKIFENEWNLERFIPIDQFNKLPLKLYAKLFFDTGWANNYPQYELNNRLTNTFLYSTGIGIDMVTLYDLVMRFEYSYNSEKELNFALNIKADL